MPDSIDLTRGFLVRHRHLVLYLEPDEAGGYAVTSPFVPCLTTQGETFEEAIAMALDADELLRETRRDFHRTGRPVSAAP